MTDSLSLLSHTMLPLCKVWRADGSISDYAKPKYFSLETFDVHNIENLSTLLSVLETRKNTCLIRGRYTGKTLRHTLRRREVFEDQPLHTVLIEVDKFRPALFDPVADAAEAIEEYITTCLPECFHKASYHWQLSNSAGAVKNTGILKAHVWFFLETPYTSAQLKAWAKNNGFDKVLDISVFDPIQVHYTSAPDFEEGVINPVSIRSSFVKKQNASVLLNLDPDSVAAEASATPKGEAYQGDDPTALWLEENELAKGIGASGQVLINCPFVEFHTDGKQGDSDTAYLPARPGFPDGVFHCSHASCAKRESSEFESALGSAAAYFETLPSLPAAQDPPAVLPSFERDASGAIKATVTNIRKALLRSEICGVKIGLDTFRDEIMCTPVGKTAWRNFTDADYTRLRLGLEKISFRPVGRELIRDVVYLIASENEFDSARTWLDTLVWDGRARVEKFFIEYFGVMSTDYARACGLYLWTALAGRIIEPGIKADMAPILSGPQGAGKTQGVKAICPAEEFFTEIDLQERDDDLSRKLRGRLVVELPELRGLRTKDRESVKAFISRTHENWIPKYREFATAYARRLIFIGTTNEEAFLADPTGERRWLPMNVGTIDVPAIKRDKNQLWAEGRELFQKSGILWQSAEKLAAAIHDEFTVGDPWAETVAIWLKSADFSAFEATEQINGTQTENTELRGGTCLTAVQVLQSALGMLPSRIESRHEIRMGKVLKMLGYEHQRKREDGKLSYIYLKHSCQV